MRDIAAWRTQMLAAKNIGDTTKLVLLLLEPSVKANGEVSVPRSTLAKRLGKPPARITEALTVAVNAGWLSRVVVGRPGKTAVYAIVRADKPDGPRVRTKRTKRLDVLLGTPDRTMHEVQTRVPQITPGLVQTRVSPVVPNDSPHVTAPSSKRPPKDEGTDETDELVTAVVVDAFGTAHLECTA